MKCMKLDIDVTILALRRLRYSAESYGRCQVSGKSSSGSRVGFRNMEMRQVVSRYYQRDSLTAVETTCRIPEIKCDGIRQ